MDIINLVVMILVGAISGTLAARIMKGDHFGFVINALLGIAGAVVGGMIFNFLNITPGGNIVKVIDETFGVSLPPNIVGMFVSATLGALLILWGTSVLRPGKKRR
ncbi:MAG: GlsB/YeaQ/YmgE family stress response membrane protein [Bacteroidota bacterium]